MKPGVPWSVKGIQPNVREAAKDAARGAGLTLGQWLNEIILEQEAPRQNGAGKAAQAGPGKGAKATGKTTAGRAGTKAAGKSTKAAGKSTGGGKSANGRRGGKPATGAKKPARAEPVKSASPGSNLDRLAERLSSLTHGAVDTDFGGDRGSGESFGTFALSVERTQQRTQTAIKAIQDDLRCLAEKVGDQSLHGSQELAPGMRALEKALFNIVDHIELTDRRNGEVLKTIQMRLSELSNRVGEAGGGAAETAALNLLESRLGALADRFEKLEADQGIYDYSLLENQLMTLNRRVDDAQREVRENPAIELLESRLDKISARLDGSERDMARGIDVEALHSSVASLRDDFDRSNTATRPAVVQAIETRLNTLSGEMDGLRSDNTVKDHVARLAERLDEVTSRLSSTQSDVARSLDPHPQITVLETRVETLANQIAEGALRSDDTALKGLETQINVITDRLNNTEERFSTPLQSIEASLSQLFESLEKNRSEAIEAAERTAIKAAQKVLAGSAGDGAPSAEHASALSALENGLAGVRAEAGEADRRTHETLEAVHDTLERVIERLSALEAQGRTSPPVVEPVLEPVVEPVAQPGRAGPGDSGPGDSGLDDFRLPPLPGTQIAADAYGGASRAVDPQRESIDEANPPEPEPEPEPEPDTDTDTEAAGAEASDNGTDFSRNYDIPGQALSRNEDFIAAARRAAQAASEAINSKNENDPAKNAKNDKGGSGRSRRRTLLFAVAALFIAVGALSVTGLLGPNLLGGTDKQKGTPTSVGSIASPAKPAAIGFAKEPSTPQSTPQSLQAPTPRAMSVTLEDPAAGPPRRVPVRAPGAEPGTDRKPFAQSGQSGQVSTMMPTGTIPAGSPRINKSSAPADIWPRTGAAEVAKPAPRADFELGRNLASLTAPRSRARDPRAREGTAKTAMPPESIGSLALRRSAASGNAAAQFEVGARFARGHGIAKDFTKAAIWYQRAGAQGLAPAQYRLGALYEKGQGVTRDKKVARIWYQRAAEQGNVKAMHNLGVILTDATLGRPDFTRAARWFQKAAQQGLTDSQYNLGILHERGLGVERGTAKAYKWFAIAAGKGDADAAKRVSELERTMDAPTLSAARAVVSGWRARTPDQAANTVAPPAGGWGTSSLLAARRPISPAAIARTQLLLKELGYTPGAADGIMGSRTGAAITEFQRERGLGVTGRPSQELIRQLEAAAV